MRRIRRVGVVLLAALAVQGVAAGTSSAKALKTCLTPGQSVVTRTRMAYFRTAPGVESPLIVRYGPGVPLTIEGSGCPTVVITSTGAKQYWYEASNGTTTGWIAGSRIELPPAS